jgi:hypothetical protein
MSFPNIRTKIRAILNDNLITQKDVYTYDTSKVFTLSQDNVYAITTVYKNDVVVTESGNWSYSSTTNKLTFDSGYSLTDGDIVQIDYTFYEDYSDNELSGYIKAAMSFCSVHNLKTFETNDDDINPEPDEAEENLLAILASIIIKPDNISYRLADVNIQVPLGSVPTHDMIKKIIASFKKDSHGYFGIIEKIS